MQEQEILLSDELRNSREKDKPPLLANAGTRCFKPHLENVLQARIH